MALIKLHSYIDVNGEEKDSIISCDRFSIWCQEFFFRHFVVSTNDARMKKVEVWVIFFWIGGYLDRK